MAKFSIITCSFFIFSNNNKCLLASNAVFVCVLFVSEYYNYTFFCLFSTIQKETVHSSTLMILPQHMHWPKCPGKSQTKMDIRYSVIKCTCSQVAENLTNKLCTMLFNIFLTKWWLLCLTGYSLAESVPAPELAPTGLEARGPGAFEGV